jgi:hypothetical protein
MYSGGRAYWKVIQQKPFEQKSSCFAYENDHWIILGLDTAYQDNDLYQKDNHGEVAWLNSIVDGAEGRRVSVVLSSSAPLAARKTGAQSAAENEGKPAEQEEDLRLVLGP